MDAPCFTGPAANCSIIEKRASGNAGKTVCNMLGSYTTGSPFTITPAEGVAEYADVAWAEGCGIDGSDTRNISAAASLAASADATVLVLGLEVSRDFASNVNSGEGESNDRLGVGVPALQVRTQLILSMKRSIQFNWETLN